MKRLLIPISIIAASFYFGSCNDLKIGDDFLEKAPGADVTLDTIFASKQYAERALAAAYRHLPYGVMYSWDPAEDKLGVDLLESTTDLCQSYLGWGCGAERHYYNGQYNASVADTYDVMYAYTKERSWEAIRKAYIFLENVDRVPDMTEREKSIRKAEAKMIIAFHYSQMLRHFGGMPWIDHSYLPEDDMTTTRMTVEETVQKIIGLLDEAARILPWKVNAADEGRMTAAGALALKSRVLLFAASPLFNNEKPFMAGEAADKQYVWYGNYAESRWQDALDAGLEMLRANRENNNFYQLVNTGKPREDFVSAYFDRYNGEVLISSHRWTNYTIGTNSFGELLYGMGGASANYADMFEMADGTPFDWNNPVHKAHPFFDAQGNPVRDIRMYETLYVNGDQFRGRELRIAKGESEGCDDISPVLFRLTYNGYGMRKFQRDRADEVNGKFYSCPLIRLPEIYLNIAEAMNELGKATTKDEFGNDAYDYINMVRNRVNMPDLTTAKAAPGRELREAILHERAIEFGYEEVRYFDLTRWKRDDLFKTPIERLFITKDSQGVFTYTKDRKVYNERGWIKNWSDRYFLIPIPLEEINKKYGLVQNPGW